MTADREHHERTGAIEALDELLRDWTGGAADAAVRLRAAQRALVRLRTLQESRKVQAVE